MPGVVNFRMGVCQGIPLCCNFHTSLLDFSSVFMDRFGRRCCLKKCGRASCFVFYNNVIGTLFVFFNERKK